MFSRGEHGQGYYRMPEGLPPPETTPDATPAPAPQHDTHCSDNNATRRRRHKRKKQSREKFANRAGPIQCFPPLCGIADADWREAGIWAIDTANANCINTAEEKAVGRTSADVLLLQETKVNTEQGLADARVRLNNLGWNAHLSLASTTAAGAPSSGAAVLTRRGNGLTPVEKCLAGGDLAHRFAAAWVDGVVKGGVLVISVYLKDGVGLDDTNTKVLDEILITAKAAGSPSSSQETGTCNLMFSSKLAGWKRSKLWLCAPLWLRATTNATTSSSLTMQ